VLISFGLVLAYYNFYVICKDIVGRNGWASPIVSAWLPNAIFLLIAVLVSRRNE
jgi:lipopolysaccharide export LptBFGC system permease protein LptF